MQTILSVRQKCRLDEFLRMELPKLFLREVSNSKVRRLIFSGNAEVSFRQGNPFSLVRNPSLLLRDGCSVKINLEEEKFFYERQNNDIRFELDSSRVLYEDETVIVVNKPEHFPTEATMVESRDNLHAAVVRYLWKNNPGLRNPPYCGIVHRLDRDTSGVILFSKQRAVNAVLHEAFDSGSASGSADTGERSAKKFYLALCSQTSLSLVSKEERAKKEHSLCLAAGKEFSVRNYIGRVSPKSAAAKWGSLSAEKGGKFSRTDFRIIKEVAAASMPRDAGISFCGGPLYLVQAELFTGRTHQIRVHLSQSGLPILGDTLYGGLSFERICLHALSLELPHPLTGKKIIFEAPPPNIFNL